MDFNPDTVDPGLVGQNRDYLVAEVEPGAIEAVLDLVSLPAARRDLPPRHDLVGFRGLDRYDRCALPCPKSPGGKRPGEDNAECAPCHCSLLW